MTLDPIRHGGWSRRDLLRALGAGTLTGALLPSFARTEGLAPTNLMLVYHPNGLEVGWEPVGGEYDFDLGRILGALERHREQLVVLAGLRGGISNEILAHNQGMVSMWTGGTIPADAGFSRYRSVDQIVADRIGTSTPLRSLELGVQSLLEGVGNHAVMIYGGPETPLPPDVDPDAVYSRLFASAAGDPQAAAAARARQASVLDLVQGRLQRVSDVLGAADRARLDAHAEGIRAIERRLDGLGELACESSVAPSGLTRQQVTSDSRFFTDVAELQVRLAAAALSCGATRVASLQLSYSTSAAVIPGLGLPPVHAVMHAGTGEEKASINAWFAGQFAGLLDVFAAVPGARGGSLLDETLLVWGTEMAVGNHLNEKIPCLLAGGGVFPGGRLLRWDDPPRHTRLLLSILRAFGIEEHDTLGDFHADRGALEELWG